MLMNDPVVLAIVVAAGAVIVLALILRMVRRARDAAGAARRRAEVRRQRGLIEKQKRQLAEQAGRIIATSSTGTIAGYDVVRQIEAVFTDGHATPNQAVEALKAVAAGKGANAIINLNSVRPPSGKCVAQGDAVVVEAPGEAKAKAKRPSLPGLPPMDLGEGRKGR